MYAQIYAASGESADSSGKTTWLNVSQFRLSVGKDAALHLGKHGRYIEINAEGLWEISPGIYSRSGRRRTVRRKFQLQLSDHEVRKLVLFALQNRIFSFDVKAQILAAYKSLSAVSEALGISLNGTGSRRHRRRSTKSKGRRT
jgi:hypothetical protein